MNTFDMSLNLLAAMQQTAKPSVPKDSVSTQDSDFRKQLEQTAQQSGQEQPPVQDAAPQEPETIVPGEGQQPSGETEEPVLTDAAALLAAMLLPITPAPQPEAVQTTEGMTGSEGVAVLAGEVQIAAAVQPVQGQAQTGIQPQAQPQTGNQPQAGPEAQTSVRMTEAQQPQTAQIQASAQAAQVQPQTAAPQAAAKAPAQTLEADVSIAGGAAVQPEQRLFGTVESVPVQVGDPVRADDPALPEQLTQRITQAAAQGQDTITVQLAPRELGQITIQLSHGADGMHIALHSENAKTLSLLSEHAANIGALVERGQTGAVTVTVEREQPGQQQQEQYAQQQRQGGGQQQERRERRPAHPHSDDFVQQLRLGLAGF